MKTSVKYDPSYAYKIINALRFPTMKQLAYFVKDNDTLYKLFYPCHEQLKRFEQIYALKKIEELGVLRLDTTYLKKENISSEDIMFIVSSSISFTNSLNNSKDVSEFQFFPFGYDEKTDTHYVAIAPKIETGSLEF